MKKWKKFVFGLLLGSMICFLLPKPVLQTDAAAPFDVNEFIDIFFNIETVKIVT